ncbi:RabGAP/TBC [Peniophora sp. CONT]|nr:RabGAP/TBC [Peniophora sp. CONT]
MSDDEKFEDVPEFESLSLDDPPKSDAIPAPESAVPKPETPKLTTAPLTPKKVGSLRDRIAAFENKGPASPGKDELKTPRPLSPRPRLPSPQSTLPPAETVPITPPAPATPTATRRVASPEPDTPVTAASPITPTSPPRPPPLSQHKPSTSASSLAALLSPTLPNAQLISPPGTARPRDSVATDADFGDVPLDDPPATARLGGVAEESAAAVVEAAKVDTGLPDSGVEAEKTDRISTSPVDPDAESGFDESFATVVLTEMNRDSTQALKSPAGEAPALPWATAKSDKHDSTFSLRAGLDEVRAAASARSSMSADGAASGAGHRRKTSGLGREVTGAEEETGIDWEYWGNVVSDYQGSAAADAGRLAAEIERGIPPALRGTVWQLMAASKDTDMEAMYLALIKESSPHEKAITRDLGRTFPHHAFFAGATGLGQENLFNVLKAYSLQDPAVGYCQGLPFVAAVLLLNMPDEEAFSLLVRLMHSYDLRGHFLPDMPKLQLRLFQFERLLEECLPVLHVHFLRQGVKISMFCSQWFLTLFSYRFPLELVYRVFDNCLASGIEAIFGFALALLQRNEERLLELKFDELVGFLNTQIIETYRDGDEPDGTPHYSADAFVSDAMRTRITPFQLDVYSHEYAEMVAAREAHAREVEALKQSNRALMAQVQSLERNMASLNDEHVQVLNELVKARLQHEEVERELVRYKLLYAESVHFTEDSLSSHRMSRMSNHSHVSTGSTHNASPSRGANGSPTASAVNGSPSTGSKRPSLQSMLSGFTKSSS